MNKWKRFDMRPDSKPKELEEPEFHESVIPIWNLYLYWLKTAGDFSHAEMHYWMKNMNISLTSMQKEFLISVIRGGNAGLNRLQAYIQGIK